MKKFLLLAMSLLSVVTFAASGGTIEDDFGSGSDEYEFEQFSNENVLALIEQDMEFACNRAGLCTLHSVTQSGSRFTSSFSFGEGNTASSLGGSNGSVIITDGGASGLSGTEEYWGVTLQYSVGSCTQSIQVPRSLYMSMNRYMYDLMDEHGNTREGFNPSKEAMIMFYSTIMKEAKGCNGPN